MEDNIRPKLKKLGKLQREIIIWLGNKQGVTTKEHLKSRWKTHYPARVAPLDFAPLTNVLDAIESSIANNDLVKAMTRMQREQPIEPPRPTPYAPYLTDSYFEETEEESLLEKGWIRWNPKNITNEEFSQAKSASFSKSIRGLEDRYLIETAKVLGKKQRISHVKLTFNGEVASVLLRQKKYRK